MPWIKEYSPMPIASPDDPSVYLIYSKGPAIGKEQKDPTHTSNFVAQEHCRSKKVDANWFTRGSRHRHKSPTQFLSRNWVGTSQATCLSPHSECIT